MHWLAEISGREGGGEEGGGGGGGVEIRKMQTREEGTN